MNLNRLTFAFIASAIFLAPRAEALTADELAQFLGIDSWRTTVDLPKDSFTVDIFEIKDGKVTEAWLRQGDEAARDPQKGMQLILGPNEGNYRLTLSNSNGTHGVTTKVPLLSTTLSSSLPEKIGAGDFIFFGQPKQGQHGGSGPERYERGFLLRVTIKSLFAAEETQAQRCLANAKQIAAACKVYAQAHGGQFPTRMEELEPDYLARGSGVFTCPLTAEPHKNGYELLGGKETDPGSNVLVRARFTAADGRRSVVYVNQWGALEWR